MLSFTSKQRKLKEAQGYLTKIINNNSPRMGAYSQGERKEERLNLTLAIYLLPVHAGAPDVAAACATVTKEFSTHGLSIVVTDPLDCEEVVIGLRWDESTTYFRGEIVHQSPIGAGLWQCGVHVTEIMAAGDYPALRTLEF